jgi:ribosome maturation factor RimP
VTHVLDAYRRAYTIDVSSPGIERPLRKQAHFRDAVGRQVTLRTRERNRVRGEVLSAGEQIVTVKTNGESVDIPYDSIVRGNLIEEVGAR